MKITTLSKFKFYIREEHTDDFKETFLFVFNFMKNKKPIPKKIQQKINNLSSEEKEDLYNFVRFGLFGNEEYNFHNQIYYNFTYYVSEAIDGEYNENELDHIIEFSFEVLNSCKHDSSFNLQEPMFFMDGVLVNFNAYNVIKFINANNN